MQLSLYFLIPYVFTGVILLLMSFATYVRKPPEWSNRFMALTFLMTGLAFLSVPLFAASSTAELAHFYVTLAFTFIGFIPLFFYLTVSCILKGPKMTFTGPLLYLSLMIFLGYQAYIWLISPGEVSYDGAADRYRFVTGLGVAVVLFSIFVVYLYMPLMMLLRFIPNLSKNAAVKARLTIYGYLMAVTLYIAATIVEIAVGDRYAPIFVTGVLGACYVTYYGFIIKE